jgi:hypothetical protein
MSFIRGELYSLRRQVVTKSELIDVFGPGWQMSATSKVKKLLAEMLIALLAGRLPKIIGLRFWFRRPNNYSGLSNDKIETLRKYKYSLVIENSVEFLTEKLFDCFFSSTIPIYVGPPLSLFGIPENLVVQVDPDLESVLNGIKAAENVDYEVWVKSLKSWMGEDSTKLRWNAIDVYNDIAISILKN